MACNTASGQPSPDEDDTVTTAPSGMHIAASIADTCLSICQSPPYSTAVRRPVAAASATALATASDLTPSTPSADGRPCPLTASAKRCSARSYRLCALKSSTSSPASVRR